MTTGVGRRRSGVRWGDSISSSLPPMQSAWQKQPKKGLIWTHGLRNTPSHQGSMAAGVTPSGCSTGACPQPDRSGSREQRILVLNCFFPFSFLFSPGPQPWGGGPVVKRELCLSVQPLWKHIQKYTWFQIQASRRERLANSESAIHVWLWFDGIKDMILRWGGCRVRGCGRITFWLGVLWG